MRKCSKILLMFAMFILVPAMCFLTTACGGENPPEKTLTSITSYVASHEKWDGEKFSYYYGEEIEFSKDNFYVTAYYSDGSTEDVTDFSLDTTNLPTGTVAIGTYEIKITYKEQFYIFNVEVCERELELFVPAFTNPVYTGEEIDITLLSEIQTFMTDNNLKVASDSESKTQTDVGSYTLKLESNDTNIAGVCYIDWVIIKKPIRLADFLVSTGLIQNGEDNNVYKTIYNGYAYNLSSKASYVEVLNDKSYTDAGDYYYTFSVINPNYMFDIESNEYSTYSETELSLTLSIEKAKLGFDKADISLSKNEDIYKVTAYTLEELFDNYSNLSNYFDISSGVYDLTNVGEHIITLSPKQNTYTNCEYANGETIENTDIDLYFTITKATPNYSAKDTENNVVFETTYYEGVSASSVVSSTNLTSSSISWLEDNLEYSDYSVLSCDNDETLTAGTHTKTIKYTPDYCNYNPVDIQVTIVVNKVTILISPNWYLYRGGSLIYETNNIVYDAKPIDVEFATGNDAATATLATYYTQTTEGAENIVYGKDVIENPTNAGFYKTVATLSCDSNHQICVQGSNTPVETIELEWKIKQADYYGYISWNGISIDAKTSSATLFEPTEPITLSATITGEQTGQFKTEVSVSYKETENGTYSTIGNNNIKEVGFYQANATITCTTGNYNVIYKDTTVEFEIISSTIDCSKIAFAIESKTYTKTEWLENFSDFNNWLTNAKGLSIGWSYEDSSYNGGFSVKENIEKGVADTYTITLNSVSIDSNYQNSENATLTNEESLNTLKSQKITITIVDDTSAN